MSNVAIDLNKHRNMLRQSLGDGVRPGALRCVLMDDDQADRRAIQRISQDSQFELEIIETSTIAEARRAIEICDPHFAVLDFCVPDGDGIEFAASVSRRDVGALPVIMVTGEGDEHTAIRCIRSGVIDYLPKADLSLDLFDAAISNVMQFRGVMSGAAPVDIQSVTAELTALRENTRRNMTVAKTFMMPLSAHAWRGIKMLSGDMRKHEAQQLMAATRRLAGALDETLIDAVTDCSGAPEYVDLGEVLDCVLAQGTRMQKAVTVKGRGDFPLVNGKWSHLLLLISQLIQDAFDSIPQDVLPRIGVMVSADPAGNPVLRVRDNGQSLEQRMDRLRHTTQAALDAPSAAPAQAFSLSLCQRLAELCGGELKTVNIDGQGCETRIRFPAHPQIRH